MAQSRKKAKPLGGTRGSSNNQQGRPLNPQPKPMPGITPQPGTPIGKLRPINPIGRLPKPGPSPLPKPMPIVWPSPGLPPGRPKPIGGRTPFVPDPGRRIGPAPLPSPGDRYTQPPIGPPRKSRPKPGDKWEPPQQLYRRY